VDQKNFDAGSVLSDRAVKTQDWYAWLNIMPPGPSVLHVKGEVQVTNTKMHARLLKREPQGINPSILDLELVLIQDPGIAGQIVFFVQVQYEQLARHHIYREVTVFSGGQAITTIPVEIIAAKQNDFALSKPGPGGIPIID
jgi:hypothetical protein